VVAPTDPAAGPPRDAVDSPDAGRRFVRGGAMRVVAYGTAALLSVAVIPFVTRYLGSARFGQLIPVGSLLVIVAILTEGGLGTVGIREYSDIAGDQRRSYMRDLLGLRIALSILGALGAIIFALIAYPAVQVEGTAIGAATLVLANVQVTLAIPLTAELRMGWIAVLDVLGPATGVLTMIVLVLARAPLLLFFVAPALSMVVTTTITARLVRGVISLRPRVAPARWRALLRTTIVYAAATALGTVYFRVVVVAMSLLATGVTVGVFSLAFRSLEVLTTLPWLLVISVWPILVRAARDDRERLRYAINLLLEGCLLLGGWFSLLLVCGGPFAASVLGGPKYPGAGEVMSILGGGVGFSFLLSLFAFAMLSLQMFRALIVSSACVVALSIVLSALLIPAHGADGGAIVTVTLEVTLATAYAVALFGSHPQLRPALARSGRILLALAVAFAAALATPVSSLPSALIGSAVLAVAVVALRAAPPELLAAARPHR
jgi:O-antigen/teichoic acid export membrane protein